MRVIIAGSRGIVNRVIVETAIKKSAFHITEVVSGTARGVDIIGEEWAINEKIAVKQFPADWNQYGKSAGYIRNAAMAKYSEALIAVWDGKSKGTKNMIDIAEKRELKVYIYMVGVQ